MDLKLISLNLEEVKAIYYSLETYLHEKNIEYKKIQNQQYKNIIQEEINILKKTTNKFFDLLCLKWND